MHAQLETLRTAAWHEGNNAFFVLNSSPMDNPYRWNDPNYDQWAQGFEAAREMVETDC